MNLKALRLDVGLFFAGLDERQRDYVAGVARVRGGLLLKGLVDLLHLLCPALSPTHSEIPLWRSHQRSVGYSRLWFELQNHALLVVSVSMRLDVLLLA